jgi:hypothetical protein
MFYNIGYRLFHRSVGDEEKRFYNVDTWSLVRDGWRRVLRTLGDLRPSPELLLTCWTGIRMGSRFGDDCQGFDASPLVLNIGGIFWWTDVWLSRGREGGE